MEHDIELADTIFVTDAVAVAKTGLQAIELSDVIAIEDRIEWTPGPIAVLSVSPPRARAGDNVIITGTGFSPRAGQNRVRVSGTNAAIVAESSTSITFTVPSIPFSIVTDILVDVVAENFTSNHTANSYLWIKPATADLAGYRVAATVPDLAEDPNLEDPPTADGQDFERLLTLIDFPTLDVLPVAGDVAARDATGLAAVTGGHDGQVLHVDPAAPTVVAWAWETDLVIPYGRSIVANPGGGGVALAVAHGSQNATLSSTNSRGFVDLAGRIRTVWVLAKNAGATDHITLIRILKNGAQVHTSGAIALAGDDAYTADVDIAVAAGDYLEIEATKAGTTDPVKIVGGLRIRTGGVA